jgi:hypothetical protein
VSRVRELELFRDIVDGEIRAALAELGERPLREVLDEAGLLEGVRRIALGAVEPGVVALARSDGFGEWLDRVLAAS